MEAYKKKLDDKHRRIIEEMHLNFLEERDRLIRDRDAEIEKEGENDILGNSVFRIEKSVQTAMKNMKQYTMRQGD